MPRGFKAGGRVAGTPNKATEDKQDAFRRVMNAAFGELAPEIIDNISPAQLLRYAMRFAAKRGFPQEALSLAKDCAPYFDAKLAPIESKKSEDDQTVTIKGGLPDE